MSAKTIHDFILKDEQNLRIAAAVSEAWPEARQKLTGHFLDRLGAKLLGQRVGWVVKKWSRYFVDRYGNFYLYKPTWEGRYYIALQAGEYGREMRMGVQRETNDTKTLPMNAEFLEIIQQIHPSAQSSNWWEGIVTMRDPETDWRPPDVLWRMNTDEAFLESVADQMLEIAKAVEPLADRLVGHA